MFLGYALWARMVVMCVGGGIVYKIANLLYNVLIITNSLYRYKKKLQL